MSLDTKYRPLRFSDVLGQANAIKIMRRFVVTGAGFHQSFLLAGQFGSGKTTLGRILARALLCEHPTAEGDPCNECPTCQTLITVGTCQEFVEVDAATNSGKADIQKIIEDIQYTTFSGRHRLYLFDEAHQLSRDALDAMLKPLEENVPGSDDKKLVCIFCTTEPEKMRATILSRCAPAFVIHPVSPQEIAERMAYICQQEGLKYDPDMLPLIAESTECHIRDAIKAIEGVSMLGDVNRENVISYLRLDLNTAYLEVLEGIGKDLPLAVDAVKRILTRTSPVTCYEKLADIAMMAYQVAMGASKPPVYWDADRMMAVGKRHGAGMLTIANRFASRPGRATASMLLCDVSQLHHGGGMVGREQVIFVPANPQPMIQAPTPAQAGGEPKPVPGGGSTENRVVAGQNPDISGNVHKPPRPPTLQGGGVYVDKRAVRKLNSSEADTDKDLYLEPAEFCNLLCRRLRELDRADGCSRQFDVGGYRIDPTRGG